MHPLATGSLLFLLLCGTALEGSLSRQACPVTDSAAAALPPLEPASLAGHYELVMVSLWPARTEDTLASGTLWLWIDSLLPLPESTVEAGHIRVPPYPRPSLIGATDAPTWRLGALSRVRPDAREIEAPGFRLIDTTLVLGACPDRVACEERHSTDLVITAAGPGGFRGHWALRPSAYPPPGVDSAGYPRGYFCAERLR